MVQLDRIQINVIDSVFVSIEASESIKRELYEKFTFEVPGYQFMPAYQNGSWDGRIRLYNLWKNTLYAGLVSKVIQFAKENQYEIEIDESIIPKKITPEIFDKIYDALNLPEQFIKKEYQTILIKKGLEHKRALLISPTGSGKSLIIYAIIKTLLSANPKLKALIAVPTKGLVAQIPKEFIEYGYNKPICKFSESKKNLDAEIYISTYHSLYKLDKKFFNQFSIIVCDECHLFAAKSTQTLLEKTTNINFKFGTTATLQETKCHALVLEGLFGPIIQHTTTKKLMDSGDLTPAKITCVMLQHPEDIRKANYKGRYQDEIQLIIDSEPRKKFLLDFIPRLPSNTLVIFNRTIQGKELEKSLKEKYPDRPIYFIAGEVKADLREEIRMQMEKDTGAILIASIMTTSLGVSIKNLHNVVFIHPTKSRNRVLQAIGRVVRVLKGKSKVNVIDIVDDLTWKNKQNTTMEHFMFRIDYYNREEHPFSIKTVQLKE